MHIRSICLCVALPLSFASIARAADAPANVPAGHSSHGEAFDEGPRNAAYLMGSTGKVHFPVTTKVPEAQQFFDQGIGQLHGFWYLEAERSFRQAAALDPGCAMAYWGMAMANVNNEKRAAKFILEAVSRKKDLAPEEGLWIDSLDAYYRADPKDNKARKSAYINALKKIVADFPADIEAKALLEVEIWQDEKDVPLTDYEAADALLADAFKVEPNHPAQHYRIHLWDGKDAKRALSAAALCGPAAPGIAHMWHMPGHIYSDLQRYEDAAYQQEASARVDHAYMMRDRVMPYQIHNYAHNNEWCIRDLLYVGRVHDAIDLARNMIELPRNPKFTTAGNRGSGNELGLARLFDALALNEMWDDYLTLSDSPCLRGESPRDEITRLRYLGVACFARGQWEKGAAQIGALESAKARLQAERASLNESPAPDKKAADASRKKMETSRNALTERIVDIDKALAHVHGQQAQAAGDHAAAIEFFMKGDVRKEHLAQAYLKAGDKTKAEQLAREAADGAKNQVYPLANYVEVLYRCGKVKEAKEAFERLRALTSRTDLDTPLFARLEPIAREFGWPADWRIARVLPDDLGERPSLDTLGPFRWSPSPAPAWSAVKPDGSTISLADYRGKPVIVIFYLGFDCLHCVQQLHAFAPATREFADAGISLVAISSDPPAALRRAADAYKSDGEFPFPLASDESLKIFKAYRAYDDFEKVPLHATFLIDARGLVRWQDIDAEPFTDTKFLLGEAKRLLAQPTSNAR
ncbi:MAG TPA: peroxiredoxin family protein [Tepidisphaeraceae bacterium]|jgi:peroxiredoxin|nr:peroxiredoxin family protein [Tepidisphaeraceae bacterium]